MRLNIPRFGVARNFGNPNERECGILRTLHATAFVICVAVAVTADGPHL